MEVKQWQITPVKMVYTIYNHLFILFMVIWGDGLLFYPHESSFRMLRPVAMIRSSPSPQLMIQPVEDDLTSLNVAGQQKHGMSMIQVVQVVQVRISQDRNGISWKSVPAISMHPEVDMDVSFKIEITPLP